MKEDDYKLLALLAENPGLSQRQLANALDVSLGKANYCLNGVIEKGLVTTKDHSYLLTPLGLNEKASLANDLLKRNREEYKLLKREIKKQRDKEQKPETASN